MILKVLGKESEVVGKLKKCFVCFGFRSHIIMGVGVVKTSSLRKCRCCPAVCACDGTTQHLWHDFANFTYWNVENCHIRISRHYCHWFPAETQRNKWQHTPDMFSSFSCSCSFSLFPFPSCPFYFLSSPAPGLICLTCPFSLFSSFSCSFSLFLFSFLLSFYFLSISFLARRRG